MRRYFMLIPEAVQLVMHAAALARGGEIFVLEMGEQIKVVDMVKDLIRLSGFGSEEIPIQIIGTRPGEKLYEELAGRDETVEPSGIDQILRIQPIWTAEPVVLEQQVRELEEWAAKDDAEAVIGQLCEMVPTYKPGGGRRLLRQQLRDEREERDSRERGERWESRAVASVRQRGVREERERREAGGVRIVRR